jgi:hypothetical protein
VEGFWQFLLSQKDGEGVTTIVGFLDFPDFDAVIDEVVMEYLFHSNTMVFEMLNRQRYIEKSQFIGNVQLTNSRNSPNIESRSSQTQKNLNTLRSFSRNLRKRSFLSGAKEGFLRGLLRIATYGSSGMDSGPFSLIFSVSCK